MDTHRKFTTFIHVNVTVQDTKEIFQMVRNSIGLVSTGCSVILLS